MVLTFIICWDFRYSCPPLGHAYFTLHSISPQYATLHNLPCTTYPQSTPGRYLQRLISYLPTREVKSRDGIQPSVLAYTQSKNLSFMRSCKPANY
jgi:hypothetical protein